MKQPGLILFLLVAISCVKREHLPLVPDAHGEEGEVITTVIIHFSDSATAEKISASFSDPDGPGGNSPSMQFSGDEETIVLAAGHTYYAELLLFNVSGEIADTVSNEVAAEGEEHMVFYDQGAPLPFTSTAPCVVQLPVGATITYEDTDGGSPPLGIGLRTTWRCKAPGNDNLRVSVKHQPDKNSLFEGGDTDVEVTFDLSIR